ncbi:MAG: biopolymer transporter ExbD [Verrucomicrobiales bacterium]|nr:biopolymer transporter ExbD [Verrucomicrobiales bacterium]
MNFFVKRRPKPVLQIISMIDILIILLIFLVVTTTFKENVAALQVSLPKTESLATGAEAEPRVGLVVTREEKIFLGDAPVDPSGLTQALETARSSRPGMKLELRIDEKVPFGTLIKLWESLKAAGFKTNEIPARVVRPGN